MAKQSTTAPLVYFALRRRAAELGIATPSELARKTGIHLQSASRLLQEEVINISIDMLQRLALHLGPDGGKANAGDWFVWKGDELHWNIKELARERLGITSLIDFHFEAKLYPQQAASFWDDEARFVFRSTLAKLAKPFLDAGAPFDIGDFFSWTPIPLPKSKSENGRGGVRRVEAPALAAV